MSPVTPVTSSPTAQEMLITPALASAWLSNMLPNRRVSQARVDAYARDMAAGQWHVHNQTIGICADGRLGDGQHRLLAIVKHGKPVKMLVTFGFAPEAFDYVDKARPRSAADELARAGEKHACVNAARIKGLALLLENKNFVSPAEFNTYRERFRAGLDWAAEALPTGRGAGQAGVAGALAYAYQFYPQDVAKMAEDLKSGANMPKGDPALVLRNHYMQAKQRQSSDVRRGLMLRTLRAVIGRVRGEEMERSSDSEESLKHFLKLADTWQEELARGLFVAKAA